MVYEWKSGVCFKANAGKCKAEIDTLSEKTRENVVNIARNRKTELNRCFEWDDTKAAEKYRLDQAGEILRSIVFVSTVCNEEVSVRAYERDSMEHNSAYRDVRESINDEKFKQAIINRVLRDIESVKNVAESYRHFFNNPKGLKKAIETAKGCI